MMTYSGSGLGRMSANFHSIIRHNFYAEKIRGLPGGRPINNNWEATYFDFNEEKILRRGLPDRPRSWVEMLVLDDSWFGNLTAVMQAGATRFINTDKLKGGTD